MTGCRHIDYLLRVMDHERLRIISEGTYSSAYIVCDKCKLRLRIDENRADLRHYDYEEIDESDRRPA